MENLTFKDFRDGIIVIIAMILCAMIMVVVVVTSAERDIIRRINDIPRCTEVK